jgi:hypothetical protein
MGVLRGAAAGAAATAPMTAVMLAGRRAVGKQPPTRIVERAEEVVGVDPPRTATNALAAAAHVGMGMSIGAAYGLLPKGMASALTLCAAVYTASYEGWIPAIGALPPAHDDKPLRPPVMIAAHAVFAVALVVTERRLPRPPVRRP